MMRRLAWGLGLVAVGCLLVGADALAGKGWDGDGETVDLADLLDGETRFFGSGEDRITATRTGDVVTLSRGASDGHRVLDITCKVPQDSCEVVVFDDDGEDRVLIAIEKRRECVNGEGDCEGIEALVLAHGAVGASRMMFVQAGASCAEHAEDCVVEIETHGGLHADHLKLILSDDEGDDANALAWVSAHAPGVVHFGTAGHLSLRCPEGDTTMRIGKDEVDETFLCPKHSVPLERLSSQRIIRKKIELRNDDTH